MTTLVLAASLAAPGPLMFSHWTVFHYNTEMIHAARNPGSHAVAYQAGAAARFVAQRLTRGEVAFPLDALEAETGLSRIAARHQLLRLGPRVRRVAPRQPFFLIVSEAHEPMGAPPAGWWLDAYFRWLRRPYYLALASAAAEYGASPQAIQLVQVMTDRPRRPLALGRVRVRFYVKRDAARTPTAELPGAYAPLRVSTLEATAIDLVRYAGAVGGMERAVETLKPIAGRLRKAALKEALSADARTSHRAAPGLHPRRPGLPRPCRERCAKPPRPACTGQA